MAPQTVSLTDLNPQQLSGLILDLEQTVKVVQAQYEALATGLKRFEKTLKAMTETHNAEQNDALIPMTPSVYQEGVLVDKDRFVVDIGAGYFIERSYEAQKVYFEKRIKQISENLKKIAGVLQERKMMHEQAHSVLQRKIGEMQRPTASQQSTVA